MTATAYVQRAIEQGWNLARVEALCEIAAGGVVRLRRDRERMAGLPQPTRNRRHADYEARPVSDPIFEPPVVRRT